MPFIRRISCIWSTAEAFRGEFTACETSMTGFDIGGDLHTPPGAYTVVTFVYGQTVMAGVTTKVIFLRKL
jgi:hypothetical protein